MANYQIKGASADSISADDAPEKEKEEYSMNDIAGLLALMQGNKNLDLPGLLALCKEKGYDRAWGGEGMFMFVFLILFLFAGGGWGNLGRNNQQAVEAMAGNALNDIIGIHDRISAAQHAANEGFANVANSFTSLDSKICQSIAETVAAVRNQGDRVYDATRTVGDAVRDCCCAMNNHLDKVQCAVDGLYGHVSLAQERTVNVIDKRACETDAKIEALKSEMALGFERQSCLITNTARQQEMDRLARENEQLKDSLRDQRIAANAVAQMQSFALNNYKPTAFNTTVSSTSA